MAADGRLMSTDDVALQGHAPWDRTRRFVDRDDREHAMHATVQTWYDELAHRLSTPMGNAQLDDWLRMHARIPFASVRNSLLLSAQCPEATELGTFDFWTSQYDCSVAPTETALWLWDPVVAPACPGCGRGAFAHDITDRTETPACSSSPPTQWDHEIVKYTPRALFARAQLRGLPATDASGPVHIRPPRVTTDEHRPDLEGANDITPDPGQLPAYETPAAILDDMPAVADTLSITYTTVPPAEWDHVEPVTDTARDAYSLQPTVKTIATGEPARRVGDLLTTIAYIDLAYEVTDMTEIRKRSAEAAGAGYATAIALGHGTRFTLPTFESPPTFGCWAPDDTATLRERCLRVRDTIAALCKAFATTTP